MLEQALANVSGSNLTMKRTDDGNGFDITFQLESETADPYGVAEGTLATVFSAFTHGAVTTVELLAL